MISASLCIRCKGRLWCRLSHCPILEKFETKKKAVSSIQEKEFTGSSPPSLFVSRNNYPFVSIAPLAPPLVSEQNSFLDNPEQWFGLSSNQIIQLRSQLIQSKTNMKADQASNPSNDLLSLQELALSVQPVEAQFQLQEKPKLNLSFNETTAPLGPIALLEKMSLQENPRIPQKVDYLVSDTAVKSQIAIQELFDHGLPVHYLSKILSAGTLGIKNNRSLVPTRWSITAIDDSVSKYLINKSVKYFQQIGEIELFASNYLGNSFFIVLIPNNWSFEMLECWLPGSPWTLEDPTYQQSKEYTIIADFELYGGRKKYADNITGAYYAARLAIAEHLVKRKRQATALVFREIGESYSSPLGVWVIRETVRNALQKKPLRFSDLDLALQYLKLRLQVPFQNYKQKSHLLDALKNQKKITAWIV
ncbi:Nre family DNA repair protein [Candidatus Micrarchaeota archaeon]|nr:Nre family DNA repair protein [Candidatus Micrarchaeota archaeon]MBU1930011.1 Nre family DNA repair protein [Candidatus Micrarchaeota archaeon]